MSSFDFADVDPSRTALLCIDFQVDVCGRGGRMVSQEADVLARFQGARERAGELLRAARQADVHVVHVVHLFEPGYPELTGAPETGMAGFMKRQGAFVAGSEGARVVDEVAPAPNETVLRKTSISPFHTTDLAVRLQRLGIDTIVVCGVVTHYAVLGVTIEGHDRGLRVIVVADACASGSVERHETALAIMGPLAIVTKIGS